MRYCIEFMLERCEYQTVDPYDDTIEFDCQEEALEGSALCIFHDENYWTQSQNVNHILKRLDERIDECLSNDRPLECIGYHFPNMKISKDFDVPVKFLKSTFNNVDFSGSTFREADFNFVVFNKEAIFFDTLFTGNSTFNRAEFRGKADFETVEFEGEAYFADAIFFGETSFVGAFIKKLTFFRSASFHFKADLRSNFIGKRLPKC